MSSDHRYLGGTLLLVVGTLAAFAPRTGGEWRTTEYAESVMVVTGDAVAAVTVRFLSLGPGACAVEAWVVGHEGRHFVRVTAPPVVWCDWQTIFEHMGSVGLTIINEVKCDTGVRSQVRWYAPDDENGDQ